MTERQRVSSGSPYDRRSLSAARPREHLHGNVIVRGIARASCAALLLVAAACTQAPFGQSGLAVRADARLLQPGEETEFTAIRSGGLPFVDNRVRWSVDPPEL